MAKPPQRRISLTTRISGFLNLQQHSFGGAAGSPVTPDKSSVTRTLSDSPGEVSTNTRVESTLRYFINNLSMRYFGQKMPDGKVDLPHCTVTKWTQTLGKPA